MQHSPPLPLCGFDSIISARSKIVGDALMESSATLFTHLPFVAANFFIVRDPPLWAGLTGISRYSLSRACPRFSQKFCAKVNWLSLTASPGTVLMTRICKIKVPICTLICSGPRAWSPWSGGRRTIGTTLDGKLLAKNLKFGDGD